MHSVDEAVVVADFGVATTETIKIALSKVKSNRPAPYHHLHRQGRAEGLTSTIEDIASMDHKQHLIFPKDPAQISVEVHQMQQDNRFHGNRDSLLMAKTQQQQSLHLVHKVQGYCTGRTPAPIRQVKFRSVHQQHIIRDNKRHISLDPTSTNLGRIQWPR